MGIKKKREDGLRRKLRRKMTNQMMRRRMIPRKMLRKRMASKFEKIQNKSRDARNCLDI